MSMIVTHYAWAGKDPVIYTYPDHYEPKLYAGVLKIIEPATFKVPDMGTKENEIAVTPEYIIAIFHSNYVVHYENE